MHSNRNKFHPFFYRKKRMFFSERGKDVFAYNFIRFPGAPLFVICPGGAYRGVSAGHEGCFFAEDLNRGKINAVVLVYSVGEKAAAPRPHEDVAELLRYLFNRKEEFGLKDEQYALMGFSAGGHLVATFALKNVGYEKYGLPRPSFLVLGYPCIEMEIEGKPETQLTLTHGDKELGKAYTVAENIDGDYPPTYVWCCADDGTVPKDNTERLGEMLSNKGVPHKTVVFPFGGHGIGHGKGTPAEGWLSDALEFGSEYAEGK